MTGRLHLPILMYHHVAPINFEARNPDLYVSPEQFELQLKFLKNNGYRTITFDELLAHWDNDDKLPKKSVILTFDDGFENNYIHAFPLMKKYEAVGTIFPVADFIGNYYTWSKRKNNPPERLLNWDQILKLHEYGFKFGSHGCTHADLSIFPDKEVFDQLKFSKEILEEKINTKVGVLAYPYGSFTKRTIEIAIDAGYKCALSTNRGNRHLSKDRYALKRVMIHHDTTITRFQYYLSRIYDIEHAIKSKKKDLIGS
jgi:peptidoglycan/xylan/chitin deacetylase (PgdA/CDA1 family)